MKTSNMDIATALAEEKERKLAEERSIAALKLQRKQRLQAMIIKRQTNLAYLKKIHQGGCYWLNAVLLTPRDVHSLIANSVSKQRVDSFFSLGISISKIVNLNAGLPVVRAFSQLMEEWEYVHAGSTMQSVKFVMAKTSPCIYPQMSPIEGLSDLARPSVYKFNNAIVFEHLQVPHIPYELDYVEVFITLCVQLSNLYEKLIHEECYSNSVIYDTIVRLDTRVKHHIINAVSKQITEVSSAKVKAGTRSLRQLAGSNIALKSTGSSANLSTGGASSNNGSIHGNPNLAQPSTNTSSAPSTSSTATTRNASPAPPASGKSTTASTIANATGAGIAGVAAVMTAEKEGRSSSAGGAAVSPQDTDNKDATNRSGSTVSVDNPIAAQHQRRSRRANVGVVSDASSAVSAAEKTESSAL